MSCFPIGRHTRRRKVPNIPDQRDEQQDRDESTEYRELRERAQVEHSLVFIPILQRLIARVRNRDRQCDIDEINEGDLRLLKDATYFGYIRSIRHSFEFSSLCLLAEISRTTTLANRRRLENSKL